MQVLSQMTNPYIFDILFVLLLYVSYRYGKRRGAFRVFSGLFGTLCAWIGANILRPTVQPIIAGILTPYATKAVTSAAESAGLTALLDASVTLTQEAGKLAQSVATLGEKLQAIGLPPQLTELASELGVTNSLSQALTGLSAAEMISPLTLLAEALVARIAPALTFFLLFTVLKIGIGLCVRVLSLDWPIIGTLNRMAGGAVGLLGGAVLLLVLCAGIFVYGSPEPYGLTSGALLAQSIIGGFLAPLFGV